MFWIFVLSISRSFSSKHINQHIELQFTGSNNNSYLDDVAKCLKTGLGYAYEFTGYPAATPPPGYLYYSVTYTITLFGYLHHYTARLLTPLHCPAYLHHYTIPATYTITLPGPLTPLHCPGHLHHYTAQPTYTITLPGPLTPLHCLATYTITRPPGYLHHYTAQPTYTITLPGPLTPLHCPAYLHHYTSTGLLTPLHHPGYLHHIYTALLLTPFCLISSSSSRQTSTHESLSIRSACSWASRTFC